MDGFQILGRFVPRIHSERDLIQKYVGEPGLLILKDKQKDGISI